MGTPSEITVTALTAMVGVVALAGAVIGYVRAPLSMPARLGSFVAALALITPGLIWDAAGLALFLAVVLFSSRSGDDSVPAGA